MAILDARPATAGRSFHAENGPKRQLIAISRGYVQCWQNLSADYMERIKFRMR